MVGGPVRRRPTSRLTDREIGALRAELDAQYAEGLARLARYPLGEIIEDADSPARTDDEDSQSV